MKGPKLLKTLQILLTPTPPPSQLNVWSIICFVFHSVLWDKIIFLLITRIGIFELLSFFQKQAKNLLIRIYRS